MDTNSESVPLLWWRGEPLGRVPCADMAVVGRPASTSGGSPVSGRSSSGLVSRARVVDRVDSTLSPSVSRYEYGRQVRWLEEKRREFGSPWDESESLVPLYMTDRVASASDDILSRGVFMQLDGPVVMQEARIAVLVAVSSSCCTTCVSGCTSCVSVVECTRAPSFCTLSFIGICTSHIRSEVRFP